MRHQIEFGFSSLFPGEMVVDLFAGGGGTSTGLEAAIRRPVDIAVNHDPAAIAMHEANHPRTRHYQEDVWAVSPRDAIGSGKLGVLWASPACTHHSRAKGGANPLSAEIRSLADVVIDWARDVSPRVIALENVEEFKEWGPLGEDGRPDKTRKGEDFRAWVGAISDLGYNVEWRSLVAADYGAPTTRKRLFLKATRDGSPIIWPTPTHGKGRPKPWRTASEIINWSLPTRSIFGRKKPLAPATMRRIAAGLRRYVLDAERPFIVPGTGAAHTLIQTGYGEREGQAPRVLDLDKPLGTVVAGGAKHALVAAFLAQHYGGGENGRTVDGLPMHRPLGTVTTQDHHALVEAAFVSKFYGTSTGSPANDPLPTVTATGQHLAAVHAFLMAYYGTGVGSAASDPLHTVTTKDRFGLVTVHGVDYQIVDIRMRMLSPRELFDAQGFPPDYRLDVELNGKPLTNGDLTRLAGNSVCPQMSEALIAVEGENMAVAA